MLEENYLDNSYSQEETMKISYYIDSFIIWCKSKINNICWKDKTYEERLFLLMNTDYIVSVTYDKFKNNYLDYLDEIVRLDNFDSNELKLVMKCIVNKVVIQKKIDDKIKSEK